MKKLIAAAMMVAVATPAMVVAPTASAREYRTYKGKDGRYHRQYYRCKRSSGTTGAVAGAVGGGVVGNVLGGGTLGTVAGAVGGGLLGRHLDKKHDAAQNRRNGC